MKVLGYIQINSGGAVKNTGLLILFNKGIAFGQLFQLELTQILEKDSLTLLCPGWWSDSQHE